MIWKYSVFFFMWIRQLYMKNYVLSLNSMYIESFNMYNSGLQSFIIWIFCLVCTWEIKHVQGLTFRTLILYSSVSIQFLKRSSFKLWYASQSNLTVTANLWIVAFVLCCLFASDKQRLHAHFKIKVDYTWHIVAKIYIYWTLVESCHIGNQTSSHYFYTFVIFRWLFTHWSRQEVSVCKRKWSKDNRVTGI